MCIKPSKIIISCIINSQQHQIHTINLFFNPFKCPAQSNPSSIAGEIFPRLWPTLSFPLALRAEKSFLAFSKPHQEKRVFSSLDLWKFLKKIIPWSDSGKGILDIFLLVSHRSENRVVSVQLAHFERPKFKWKSQRKPGASVWKERREKSSFFFRVGILKMSLPVNSLYSLTWGDYGTSLVSAVQLLRCHGDLVYVTLAAEGRSFEAHKIVLCAASPYLLNLLKVSCV